MFALLAMTLAAQITPSADSTPADSTPAGLTLPAYPKQDSTTGDTVYYSGKKVTFYARKEEVVLLDSAWVRYGDMTVYSDSIRYDTKIHRLAAYGDVLFTSADQNITGDLLQYDVDTRKGMMRTARTELPEGFFAAEEVWLVDEKALNARHGHYTTCEMNRPHYDFYGPRVKLLMDDVAITRPVVFRTFRFPVLAAPFWLVPVASERKSGLLPFKVGNSSLQGWYAKNIAYYWVINDYADATFTLDVMTRKGIQPRFEGIYKVLPFADGRVDASYVQEWDTGRRRYNVAGRHESERFFLGTRFDAEADFVSDASYTGEYAEDDIQWIKRETQSHAQIRREIGRVGSFSAVASRTEDFQHHINYMTLPSVNLSLRSWKLPFSWTASPGLSFSNLVQTYTDSAAQDTASAEFLRGRAGLGLGSPEYSLGPAGGLTVSHSIAISESRSYYNDSLTTRTTPLTNAFSLQARQKPLGLLNTDQRVSVGQTNQLYGGKDASTRYNASAGADMTLYRVFGLEAFGFHGLLHTTRPGLSLEYRPEVTPRAFIGTPVLLSPEYASLSMTLSNGFEAKAGSLRTKHDIGRLDLGTAYDLTADSLNLSPLSARARLNPLPGLGKLRLSVDADASFDFYETRIRDDWGVNTSLSWEQRFWQAPIRDSARDQTRHPIQRDLKFEVGLGHTFSKSANMVRASAALYVPGWKLTLSSLGYNFKTKDLTNYNITIWRDLHCWEAIVSFDRLGETWKYDFEVRIRKLTDIKFGKGTVRSFLPLPE
ncbi:MAG: LPS-assembly protein LptD [candidate division WOR-3 bacterium]|nr:MAG: LPS-assembly protein LptD [candidate division WOR-3 bacterium]